MHRLWEASRCVAGYGLITAGVAGAMMALWTGILMLLAGLGIIIFHGLNERDQLRSPVRSRRLPFA